MEIIKTFLDFYITFKKISVSPCRNNPKCLVNYSDSKYIFFARFKPWKLTKIVANKRIKFWNCFLQLFLTKNKNIKTSYKNKVTMEGIRFLYFSLDFCGKNNNLPFHEKSIRYLFSMNNELLESDDLNLFKLSQGIQIDDNEYFNSWPTAVEWIEPR